MITPREYQKTAIDAGVRFFKNNNVEKPKLLVAPTAAGKSIIVALIALELDGNVLVLQPSVELLKQNFEKYWMFADNAEVYSASAKSKKIGKVTFATIGSIVSVPDLFKDFQYLIIDEAHLYPPNQESMFGKFRAANPQLKILGLTATPFRLRSSQSGSKLTMMHGGGNIYNGYCHIIQIQEIAKDYWCPLRYVVDTGNQKVLKINTTGAEYTEESIAQYGKEIEGKVMEYVNKSVGFSKLVFVPTIEQANALSAITPNSAAVSSKTPKAERERIIHLFKSGKIETVFNVNLLSVGFDYPQLRIIIDAVPTMSLARYYQKIGRLTRQHTSKKVGGVVDLAGNVERFGRVEDLEIRKIGTTYHVFSGDKQLTGVLFGNAFAPKPVKSSSLDDLSGFEDMVMGFGAHRDKKISQTPISYLSWVMDNVDWNKKLVRNIGLYLQIQKQAAQ